MTDAQVRALIAERSKLTPEQVLREIQVPA